nr:IclR family transcriptional regulator C-terminal domain-containing protein [Diaphorobacter sp. HDW4A]
MQSLARGLQVLLAFSEKQNPSSVAEIARRTALDRAVVRRCIHTLECLDMVRRDGTKYLLDANVLNLGHAYFSSIELVQRAQPSLDALSEAVHTNCALAMLSRSDVVYLVRSQSRRLTQRSLGMGSRLPAHCTSLGRVLLAQLDQVDMDEYFAHASRPQITPHTITDETTLRGILSKVRDAGFAVVNQEVELDLVGIAIPVRMKAFPKQLALSVTISPRYTAANEMKARYLDRMRETSTLLELL